MKKFISLLLAVIMLLSFTVTAFAEDTLETPDASSYEGYELFEYLLDFYLEHHVFQPGEADVLRTIIINLINNHPEVLEEIIYYLMKSADPYSQYFSAEQYEEFMAPTTYYGIGITVEYADGYIWVDELDSSSPAAQAGVKVGDYIYSVDGKKVAGMQYEYVTAMIRGDEGTTVRMGFYRNDGDGGYVYEVDITRLKITSDSLSCYFTTDENGKTVGVAEVRNFKSYLVYFHFVNFLENAVELGVSDLIIDLRGNLGGSLSVCLDMINWLTPAKSKPLCIITVPKTGERTVYSSTGRGLKFDNICVLVNESSASASELFAKSLQDNGYATIIGSTTYGKAIGQSQYQQEDGSVISVSDFEVLSPKGTHYNGIGVIPDIEAVAPYTQEVTRSFEYLNTSNYKEAKNYAENDTVYALEQRLVLLGYLETADRVFDKDTVNALWNYQERNNLERTATLTLETLVSITDTVNLVKLFGEYKDDAMIKAMDIISK